MSKFLGQPIEGDIIRAGARDDQRPLEELQPLFQAVIDDPHIAGVQWQQYTHYFNDGDECIFHVRELAVEFAGHPATEEDAELHYADERNSGFVSDYTDLYKRKLGGRKYLGRGPDGPLYETIEGELPSETVECVSALKEALEGGFFDNVLLDLFGDHAEVTVRTGEPVQVEEYQHD